MLTSGTLVLLNLALMMKPLHSNNQDLILNHLLPGTLNIAHNQTLLNSHLSPNMTFVSNLSQAFLGYHLQKSGTNWQTNPKQRMLRTTSRCRSLTSPQADCGSVRGAAVPCWITVKADEDPQPWSPWQRVCLWAGQLLAEVSKCSSATEQMMLLSTENKWLLLTDRSAHALLTAHWTGPLSIYSCWANTKKIMSLNTSPKASLAFMSTSFL